MRRSQVRYPLWPPAPYWLGQCQYNVTGWDRSHGLPNLSRVWQHVKFSDVSLDDKLNWQMHSSAVCKKLNRRMFFLRKLRSLKIYAIVLSLFYRSTIQSILSFCIAAWEGNIRYKDKCTMNRIIKKACKICSNINLPYFDELLLANTTSKIHAISIDVHHPIAAQIVLSSHRNKPIYLKCKKERYRKSFVPSGIRTL